MYLTQETWAELLHALLEYEGADAYADLLAPWLASHQSERQWLGEFDVRTRTRWKAATHEDLCRLYAMSRVTATLLLRFQQAKPEFTTFDGTPIDLDGFTRFHTALGFRMSEVEAYHPFYHEIVAVTRAAHDDEAAQIESRAWPCLMLGELMYCRAGCVVRAGARHIVKPVAESSKLYWTYRRNDRACDDQSHGWGGRSQWQTRLRRDYCANGRHAYYNIDATSSLNDIAPGTSVSGGARELPVDAMIELVRNRCMVRTAIDDTDLDPYPYAFTEPMSV